MSHGLKVRVVAKTNFDESGRLVFTVSQDGTLRDLLGKQIYASAHSMRCLLTQMVHVSEECFYPASMHAVLCAQAMHGMWLRDARHLALAAPCCALCTPDIHSDALCVP